MVTKAAPATPPMRQNTVLGWLSQLLLGLTLIGAGIEVVVVFGTSLWFVLLGAAVVGLLGVAVLVRAELLERPQRVLRKARRTLNFPTQWSVKFNKRIVQGGVVPVAVIRADGVRFVIDIQACKSVSWGTPTDGSGQTPLVGPNGKRLKPDPVAPLLQAALGASAAPVLWLPEAIAAKNLRHPESNLIVVMGTARDLKHALQGAEIAPIKRLSKQSSTSAGGDAAREGPTSASTPEAEMAD
jgi:hypothetical protein